MQTLEKTSLWAGVKRELQALFPPDVYNTWFASVESQEDDDTGVTLTVSNDFAAIWIQDNYYDLISKKLEQEAGHPIALSFAVSASEQPETKTVSKAPITVTKKKVEVKKEPSLSSKNTFENFVVGPGNQLAHAAAIAISNAPAKAYNPLFLYGDTGLGKTHLMHAVAHHSLSQNPDLNVVYISTEKFTNEFIHAIQENQLVKFRKHYRQTDILLIDDIHFLSGKERIQEEFFHTFNELFESQKQIFLCSDRPASEIAKLESRLVSRFQWGLVCDIQPPDFETRVAILSKKANSMQIELDRDVLSFLAERVTRNVRRMEGALTRLASYSKLMKGPIDVPSAATLLKDILQEEHQVQITIDRIQQKVCAYYRLNLADMVSKRRPANIAFPRQVAMYVSRLLTNCSLQEIGEAFGGRDHGTVIHACKMVENTMEQDESVKRTVEFLQNQIASNR
ncbi:MAG: chromosomal replication initiator DnaA [Verrucomicrobia bacterium GWF2_51_19]|nr:MAG: chromosomal replication initiator DnaA [Verrucomicrobia bacterium GWF2_51_19]HCJ11889.1 chromosomal replication initiator protein DnaA [Opitutae bacterium]